MIPSSMWPISQFQLYARANNNALADEICHIRGQRVHSIECQTPNVDLLTSALVKRLRFWF